MKDRSNKNPDPDDECDKKQDRFLLHARVTFALTVIPTANTAGKPFFSIAVKSVLRFPAKSTREIVFLALITILTRVSTGFTGNKISVFYFDQPI
jgi:hypothetical protein